MSRGTDAVWCVSSRHPAAFPSHVSVPTPGSIHEGGELGYALIHAFGAAFDNPGPARRLRRRRRRGRDRPARRARGRACASSTPLATAPSFPSCISTRTRSQDRRSSGARPTATCETCCTRTATTCVEVAGSDPTIGPPRFRRGARRVATRSIRAIQHERASDQGRHGASALARHRAADPEGLDRPEGRRRSARRGHVARAPGADRRPEVEPGPSASSWKRGCGRTTPRRSSTTGGRLVSGAAGTRPGGRSTDGRQSSRERRAPAARPRRSATTRGTRSPVTRHATTHAPSQPAQLGIRCCATSSPTTARRRTSGSSAPTRPTRTGSAPSSRWRTAASWTRPSRTTSTFDPTAASWRCSPSISVRDGSRATSSPAVTGVFATYEAFAMVSASMSVQHTKWLEALTAWSGARASRRSTSC